MKEKELRKHAICAMCGKKIGHTGLPLFWTVKVERWAVNMGAVRRQGGLVVPQENVEFTPEQARELEGDLDRRFKGKDKAHRWGVLRFQAKIEGNAVTPKDAEFLGALEWSLEEVARAYHIPLDIVGGQADDGDQGRYTD